MKTFDEKQLKEVINNLKIGYQEEITSQRSSQEEINQNYWMMQGIIELERELGLGDEE